MAPGGGSLGGIGWCVFGDWEEDGLGDLGVWFAFDLRQVEFSVLVAFLILPRGKVNGRTGADSVDGPGIGGAFFWHLGILFLDLCRGNPEGYEKTGLDGRPVLETNLEELQAVFP